MGRILIVYYSRTGNTARVAKEVAGMCDATTEAVQDAKSRSGLFGYLRSGREAFKKILAPVQDAKENPADFDTLALGTPVWAGNLASPMRTYISTHRAKFPRVAFFCTEGGAGAERVFRDMAALCETKPIATLVVTEKELKAGTYRDKAPAFAEALKR